jgi:hypothetical protein
MTDVIDGTAPTPAAPDDASEDAKLTAALAAAQHAFPVIPSSRTANVRGKDGKPGYTYSYADLSDVLAAARPVLAENGIALAQRTELRDGKIILVTEIRHVGGGVLASEIEVAQSPGAPQAFGGALTYLRRYEIVTLLGLAAEEDRNAQDVPPAQRAEPLPAWALPAGDNDTGLSLKRGALEALTGVIGDRDLAREYLGKLAEKSGGVPTGVAGWLGSLPAWIEVATARREDTAAPADPPDPDEPSAEELERQARLDYPPVPPVTVADHARAAREQREDTA